jgi:Tfp pilus assembly protein FimT
VVELVVALAIAFLLLGISLPGFIKSWKTYKLGNQATLIANELDLLRFTAVRQNTTLSLYYVAQGSNTVLFVDSNKNFALDPTEPQLLLPAEMQIMNGQSGVPATSSMGAAYATTFSPASGAAAGNGIAFGPRGTVSFTGASAPYVIVIGYPNDSQYGYRAVTVTPMGEIKVWVADSGGTWNATS